MRIDVRKNPAPMERFGALWTPTIVFLDPSGTERYRFEGYLPVPDFLARLTLGLGHVEFAVKRYEAAEKLFEEVVRNFHDSEVAPEALYWKGVARYKRTNDPEELARTAAEFDRLYTASSWAKKASVWARPRGRPASRLAGRGRSMMDLSDLVGSIDIYLLDQILRGRIRRGMSVFDAGCGSGRNLVYFLRQGQEVSAVDSDSRAIEEVRALAATLAPRLPASSFRAETIESNTFPDESADVVLSSAVLHFARDEEEFLSMLAGSWRVLRPGGLFFCRLASSIGMEGRFVPVGGRRFRLLDGTERFLVDDAYLVDRTRQLGGSLVDPLKTTVVQNLRCMTTWVVRRTS